MSSTNDNMFLKHTVSRSYSLNILYEHGLPTKTHILSISLSFPNHLKYMYPATEPVTINQTHPQIRIYKMGMPIGTVTNAFCTWKKKIHNKIRVDIMSDIIS